MNISNYTINPYTINPEIQARDLIRDFVIQVDNRIILAIILIYIGFTSYKIILPRAYIGIIELSKITGINPFWDISKSLIKWLKSLSETFVLASATFIVYIAHIQGILTKTHYIIILLNLGIVFLVFLVELIGYVRKKKFKKWGFFRA